MLKISPAGDTPEGGHQHHVLLVEVGDDLFGDHLAYRAGEAVIDAIHHPDRLGGEEVAAGDAHEAAGHRGVGQALGEQRLHLDAGHRHRRLDALEGRRVGDAQAVVVARGEAAAGQLGLDLRPRAVHQHQAHAQRGEQVAVVGQLLGKLAGRHLAAKAQHEGLAAKGMDEGRRRPHPGNETLGKVFGRRGGVEIGRIHLADTQDRLKRWP